MEQNLKQMPDILKMSLYECINMEEYSYEQIIQILTFSEAMIDDYSISSLDCYCKKCDKSTTFKSRSSASEILETVYLSKKACEEYNRHAAKREFNYSSFISTLNEIEFFTRSFYCPRTPKDNTHDIIVVLRFTDKKIVKIGQFPQLADLENSHLNKYMQLDKEIFKELNRATGLNSHGIGVGSFVYLRRIIEKHIVYPEIEKLIQEGILTTEQVNSTDFKGKVGLIKEYLPSVLVENPRIYSLLSKGIHTLSEQECLEIFQPILTAIELILDERLEKIEREKKLQRIKHDLNRISS